MNQSSSDAGVTNVNYERRIAGFVLASVVLVCVGVGVAVAAPSVFTIGCAAASALCAIWTLRSVRGIRAALKEEKRRAALREEIDHADRR